MKTARDALNLLAAVEAPDGDGYIYRANEVDEWYRFDEWDLDTLGELMNSVPDDPGDHCDPYTPWCNSGHCERIGTDDEARQLGLIDDDGCPVERKN